MLFSSTLLTIACDPSSVRPVYMLVLLPYWNVSFIIQVHVDTWLDLFVVICFKTFLK